MDEAEKIQNLIYKEGLELKKEDYLLARKQIELIGSNNYVLDVGCNEGSLMSLYAHKNKAVGLELSKESAVKAKKKGFDVKVGSVYKIPFKENIFDVVHMSEIIEHVLDTDKAISEVYRVLKKNGKLIITTPNCASFRDRILVLTGHLQGYMQHTEHVRFFNKEKLTRHLRKNKFKIEKVYGSGFSIPYFSGKAVTFFFLDSLLPATLMQRLIIVAEK
mgnify:FL=1